MLAAQPGGFVDDDSIVTRLEQTPAQVVILSAADTTLALLAAMHPERRAAAGRAQGAYPGVRLANLLHLRQHASIDLYVDEVLQHAKVIIVDHLGGESYWPYGTERIVNLCRARAIALAMFSGDASEDANLLARSTAPAAVCRQLWRYLREGGADNARQFYAFIAQRFFEHDTPVLPPKPLPAIAVFHPEQPLASIDTWRQSWRPGAPVLAIVFYRAHLQAGNTRVFEALCAALLDRGLNPLPVALSSLKDPLCLETLRTLCRTAGVQLVLNSTAFASHAPGDGAADALIDDLPVFQLIMSGDNRAAWERDAQGLRPRDIAMHVAMPEVDGRIITRAVSFKGLDYRCALTQSDVVRYQPDDERIAFVARLAGAWCALRRKPNADKRLALILANYPTREGRLGNGVGLDTPASVLAILRRLAAEGYRVADIPAHGDALLRRLKSGVTNDPANWPLRPAYQSLAMADYRAFFARLPRVSREAVLARWGRPEHDPMLREGRFMLAGLRCGQVFVGIQPARGYHLDPLASYHDPDLVPPHAYLAFYCWLREVFASDAVVHVGKHGSLEWLPGKSVALGASCWPDLVFGPIPHLYPFIVNDPGEGTQAKRRAQAVIVDHLMPPLTRAENYGPLQDLERLLDEYYEALSMDPRRAALLRRQILKHALEHHLHSDLGLPPPASDEDEQALLKGADAYLCELKESQIRDGLHVFGRSPTGRQARDTLLALARYPVGAGRARDASLIRALAEDLLASPDFDPLDAAWEAPWQGPRPAVLAAPLAGTPWRHCGDTRERLECLAGALIEDRVTAAAAAARGWPATARVLERLWSDLAPRLDACGEQELRQLLRGLAGRFVPPGPSGAPSRGRPDVLPTGRNFFSVDTRAIPTPTSWQLGCNSAARLVEKYQQEEGDFPRSIGLSVWGTATMRTGGDDIAQAFALLGVRPKWASGSGRVSDFEILPMSLFDRPRVDVTLRVSGFFRDAFSNVMRLFDAAVQALAELDEPPEVNPIRARIEAEARALEARGLEPGPARRRAGHRVYGAKPGAYGAGLQGLIDSRAWQEDADLARAFCEWGGYAYGQEDYGVEASEHFARRLAGVDLVVHNQDNREHDLLDSDDYYQFQGGMTAAVRHLRGEQPQVYCGDHANPAAPRLRSLAQEISRVLRSRVTNPKWIAGVRRHGYKGAFEMAATVDYLFAYDATARVVRDDQYAAVADSYVLDADNRAFMQRHNPDALHDICERLLEAIQRGLWQAPGAYTPALEQHLLEAEQLVEG